jgi:hypothetical protein
MGLFLEKKVNIEICAYMTPIQSLLIPGYQRGLVQNFAGLISLIWHPIVKIGAPYR